MKLYFTTFLILFGLFCYAQETVNQRAYTIIYGTLEKRLKTYKCSSTDVSTNKTLKVIDDKVLKDNL